MTGRELVAAALRKIGAIAPGEGIANDEAQDGLSEINRMISGWSNERLLIYTITEESFSLVSGTSSYTIGSSGTFNTTRPQWIERANIKDESGSDAIELPIRITEVKEWSEIAVKEATSDYPCELYYDGGYPLRTIKLYPTPSATHKLVLFSAKPLTAISNLATTISLPPGYEEALVYNAAVRLAPEYGKAAPNEIVMIANQSKAGIKRANQRPSYLKVDEALTGGGRFNIFTGDDR